MTIIKPTEEQKKLAKKEANKHPTGYSKRSYRKGSVLYDSKICEFAVADHYNLKIVDSFDYDFVSFSGKKIDLKTKPKSNCPPQPSWNVCVPSYQFDKQKCDWYIFARINKDLDKIWVVGYIDKITFGEKATFVKKGELDPDSSFEKPWVCPEDSLYLKIKELDRC